MAQKSIRKKFLILSALILSVLLIFGAFTAQRVDRISELGATIQGTPSLMNRAASQIEMNVVKMHREMKDVVLLMDEADQAKAIRNVDELEMDVYGDIALIDSVAIDDEDRRLLEKGRELFDEWKPIRDSVINLISEGNYDEARDITRGLGASHVGKLEIAFSTLSAHSNGHINDYLNEIEERSKSVLAAFLVSSAVMIILIAIINLFTFKRILESIKKLKSSMGEIIRTKSLAKVDDSGDIEIAELAVGFNELIDVLTIQLDLKEKITLMHGVLSEIHNSKNLTDKYLETVAGIVGADYGALYMLERESGIYKMAAGHAALDRYPFKSSFEPGEGLVGRVASSGSSIFLSNLKQGQIKLKSSFADIVPENLHIYPVKHGSDTICVVELAKNKPFTEEEIEFLKLSAESLAPYVTGVWREEEVEGLLAKAEVMNKELTERSEVIEQNSKELEHMNRELEQNSNEIEQVNSELEHQKKELIEKGSELARANSLKSDFLANVSHELRTPLNSIILLSDMILKKKSSDEDGKERLQVIRNSGGELLELINNLLDISKIESGKMDVHMEPVSTIQLGERLRQQFSSMAESKGLEFEIVDKIRSELVTDKQKLLQILTNFLSNAFKFTKEGHVKVRIHESAQPGYDIAFSVEDTGIGIRDDYKATIFEEFIQGDGSITREYGGTGLGLAICKKMADLINGMLTMESETGEGSEFSVHLTSNPYVEDMKQEDEQYDFRNVSLIDAKEDELVTLSDTIKPGGGHLLLIEDDDEFASLLKTHVNRLGYKMTHSKTGYDGILKAGKTKPSGIILDLVLPDISGARVLREIKMNPMTRGIPVHVLTVKEGSEALPLKRMGAVGFTRKTPQVELDAKEVLDGIERVIKKKPKKILIVEDDKSEVDLLKDLLGEWNIAIDSAEGVSAAKKMIDEKDYDSVVVDLGLRDGSGWDICRHVKERKLSLPVIVYTAKTLSESETMDLKKYSDSIILKSADSKGDLLEEIAIFIHKVYEWQDDKPEENVYEALAGKTILVCDDDARNVFALSSLLEEFDVNVIEAYNGEEAIERLVSDGSIDLVLMDIMMPKMDGMEAMRRIRKMDGLKDLPIIALTAKAMKGDKENCLAAGASDYLWKPVDMDILLKLMVMWLGVSR